MQKYYDTIGKGKVSKARNHAQERAGVQKNVEATKKLLDATNMIIKQEYVKQPTETVKKAKDYTLDKINDALEKNEAIQENIGCLSDSIEVLHTLGYGGKTVPKERVKGIKDNLGNIIQPRLVESVSCIVGYIIRNVGDTAINYMTELFSFNDKTGRYEGERICKVLEPGGITQISKMYFNLLLFMPEFNGACANGKLVCGGGGHAAMSNADDEIMRELNKFYFTFSGNQRVHDSVSGIKLAIAREITDETTHSKHWCVTSKYIDTFGNLNNKKKTTYKVNPSPMGFSNASDMAAYMRKSGGGEE